MDSMTEIRINGHNNGNNNVNDNGNNEGNNNGIVIKVE